MTVRRLVLLRHAKAEPPHSAPDAQRPLSARGRRDAAAAGQWLAAHQPPELVLCSPATRTRQTWLAAGAGLPTAPPVRYEPELYSGDAARALELIRATEESVGCVLVVGHNPTLSQLAFALDPGAGLDSGGLATCGLSVHELTGGWADCAPGTAPITATHRARG